MIYIQQILKMISKDRFGKSVSGGGNFMFQKLILTLCFIFTALCVFGQVKYVTPTGTGDGTSWANAAGEAQLNGFMMTAGTTVWAAKGTYKLSIQAGTPGNHFTLAAGSKLYGGFAGTETKLEDRVRDATGKWNFTNETFLSQDQATKASNSRVLYMHNGTNTSSLSVIDGVTLSGGDINGIENGAGICTGVDANYILIENCKILNNNATGFASNATTARGAGVYLTGGKLINSLVKGNVSNKGGWQNGYGGGVCIAGADVTVQGCDILENKVTAANDGGNSSNGTNGGVGGGICVFSGSVNAKILDCLIKGNNANVDAANTGASGYGAGVYLQAPTLVENCTIEGNTITGAGGGGSQGAGIAVQSTSTINNCTISLNSTIKDCAGLHLYGSAANTVVSNCIIASNKGSKDGGGGVFTYVPVAFINCLFVNNESGSDRSYNGALAVQSAGSGTTVTNCTFANNKIGNGGAAGNTSGISIFSWGNTTVKNTVFVGGACTGGTQREVTTWDSAAITLENCAIEKPEYAVNNGGGTLIKTNCIENLTTAGFVNPIAIKGYSADWNTADWSLKSNSVCIGSATASGAPSKDILGKERASIPCIGAYEFQVPQTFYVKATASGIGDGSSWDNAAGGTDGINAGLTTLSQNIYVAEGTYVSTNTASEDKKGGFEIPAGVSIYGGFPVNGGELSSRDSTKTILKPAQSGGNVLGRVVTVLGANVRLDGLTISGGLAGGVSGGGVAVHGASFKMNDCSVLSNSAEGGVNSGGGGMYINAANAVVQNSLFVENKKIGGNGGGAIYVSTSGITALIEDCTIYENTSALSGGGLYIDGASATVRNCRLLLNTATGGNGGGAIYLNANGALIQNCLVYHNHGTNGGGGFMGTDKNAKIVNSLFIRNSSTSANKMNVSGTTGAATGTSTQFINSIAIQGCRGSNGSSRCSNLSSVSAINSIYSEVKDGTDFGTTESGCKKLTVSQNDEVNYLKFVRPCGFVNKANENLSAVEIAQVKASDYQLTDKSTDCIDAGIVTELALSKDIIGVDRPQYFGSDIGAYEFAGIYTPTVVYVNTLASSGGDGTTWAKAYKTIQEGINAAGTNGTVLVATGSYNITTPLSIVTGVKIYGGFKVGETNPSERATISGGLPWDFINETIINRGASSADVNGAVLIIGGPTASDFDARLDGLTFTGGFSSASGGGIDIKDKASVTMTGCKVIKNKSTATGVGGGGGLVVSENAKKSSFVNCLFSDNSATSGVGGGVNVSSTIAQDFTGCQFIGNTASQGGGIALVTNNTNISSSVFLNNTATAVNIAGGGIWVKVGMGATVVNSIIAHNQVTNANGWGAGFAADDTQRLLKLTNCTIVGNKAGNSENTRVAGQGATLINCVLWNNKGGGNVVYPNQLHACNLTNCAFPTNGFAADDNNLFIKPNSVIGPTSDAALGDWRLSSGSALLDKGTATNAPRTDILGAVRPIGGGYDIGAYEMDYSTPIIAQNGIIYLTQSGSGLKNGNSWENAVPAYRTLDAIKALRAKEHLWIAKGSYALSGSEISLEGDRMIFGGFEGIETSLEKRVKVDRNGDKTVNDWEFLNETILTKANNSGRMMNLSNGAGLNGLTIKEFTHGSDGAVQMKGTVATKILNCEFRELDGRDGGALLIGGGDHLVSACNFVANTSTATGGAIKVSGSAGDVKIEKSIFVGNKAATKGGAISVAQNGTIIVNCLVANNEMGREGAINTEDAENCKIINSTIVKNKISSGSWGAGVSANRESDKTMILNSVIWGNQNDVLNAWNVYNGTYKNCYIGPSGTADSVIIDCSFDASNIGNNANFVDPSSGIGASIINSESANWHIISGSPLKGIGLNVNEEGTPSIDLDNQPRVGKVAAGAFEGRGVSTDITTVAEFMNATKEGVSYVLKNDLVLDGTYTPFAFNGFLVGSGFTIRINSSLTAGGIFTKVGTGSSFESLNVEVNSTITNTNGHTGVFVGSTTGLVSFKDISVTINNAVTSTNGDCGGLIGRATGTINAERVNVSLKSGLSIGSIEAIGTGDLHAGGLLGRIDATKYLIKHALVDVGGQGAAGTKIAANSSKSNRVGGLLGWSNGSTDIQNMIITGSTVRINADGTLGQDVKGLEPSYVGGLIGGSFGITMNKSIAYVTTGGSILINATEITPDGSANYSGICGSGDVTGNNVFYLKGSATAPAKGVKINNASNVYLIDSTDSLRIAGRMPFVKTSDNSSYASTFDYMMISISQNHQQFVTYERAFLNAKSAGERGVDFIFDLDDTKTVTCVINLNLISSAGSLIYYVKAGSSVPSGDIDIAEIFDATTNPDPYGLSWTRPYAATHLQRALDKAGLNGGQVWVEGSDVAEMQYRTRSQLNKIVERGLIKPAFVIPAGVSLYGGFGEKENSIDRRKKKADGQLLYVSTLDATFISGDGTQTDYDRVVYMEFGGTLDGFLLKKGEVKNAQKGGAVYASAMSTLQNLTVKDNKAVNAGAGIVLESGTVLKNSIIEKNVLNAGGTAGYGYGAGVYVDGTDVTISDCQIRENTIETTGNANNGYGAGILVGQDSVLISKCDIRKNKINSVVGTAGVKGAGVCALGRITLKDNMIIENDAGTKSTNGMNRGMGGGLYIISAKSNIENNKIYANYAGSKGGGIFAGRDGVSTGSEDILFYNNIVAHNHAQTDEGGGIHIIGTQKTRIINCSFLKNSTQQSSIANVRGGGNATEFINSIACQGFVGTDNSLAKNNLASVTASNSVYYGKSNVTVVANSNCYEMQNIDNSNMNYLNFETPTTFNKSNAELTTGDISNVEKANWMHREGRCFDRGRTIADVPAIDIRGQKRPQASAWDAGAYEYKPTLVISTFDVTPKTSSGEDIYLKATLSVDNPMPVAIRVRLAWTGGGTQYMRMPPTEVLIQPGAREGSISAKLRPIDKNSTVKLTISTDETEAVFDSDVSKEYTVELQPPVFTSDYKVRLIPSKGEFTEGESGSVYGVLTRPQGSSQPPGPIGISLKSLLDDDLSSFEFGSNEDDKVLWFNYGEEISNNVTFKVISKLGEQFNGTQGRNVAFTKDKDYAQGHLSLEADMSLKITDISNDKLTKVNAVFNPIADAFTSETTRITITLDTKLNSTTPLNINLKFSPETLGIKTAVLSINPNQTEGSFDVVVPGVLPRTTFTVTATAQESAWVNSLEPPTRTFKAGNSIIYVNTANTTQNEDGLSFATGYRKIETAISMCNATGADGEEIRIAKGIYSLENPITITGKILLKGGFDPLKSDTELRVTGEYPWDMVDSTIIRTTDNKVAIYAKGYSLIDGLTLQKTGGVVLTDSVRMINTKIIDNVLTTQAGAVLVDAKSASVMIERCLIFNNTTTSADDAAGAIKSFAPSYINLTIRNSMIANNRAAKGAGATYGQITIENSLVVHNSLTVNEETAGAGAFNGGTRLIGSTVVKNQGGSGGSIGHVNIINSIFWKNLTSSRAAKQVSTFDACSFSAFEGLIPEGFDPTKYLIGLWDTNEGSSSSDKLLFPEFTRNSSFDGGYIENATIESLGNWRLRTNMSNMGTNRPNGTPVYAFDLDNTARIKKEIVDLGCYESDLSGLLTVEFDLTKADTIYFGAAHTVSYTALFPMEGRVISLKYSSNGTIVDSPIDAGVYSIIPSDPAFTIIPKYVNDKNQFEIKPIDIEVTMSNQSVVIKTKENVLSKLSFTTNIPIYERDIKTMTQKIVVPVLPPNFTLEKEGKWVISGTAVKGNYNVTKITNAELNVIKQFVDVNNVLWIYPDGEAAGNILTYNGNERLCKVRFVGDLKATPSKNDYSIEHSETSPRNPGKYTASLKFNNESAFTANSTFLIEYTIKPMEIELDMTTPTRKIYGDKDPQFYLYSTTPKMYIGDALNVVNTTREEGENCRPQGYKFSTLNWSHECYIITRYDEGTLMIDPATINVTPKNAELPYNQKPDPKLFPVTITGMKLNDSLDAIYGANVRPECMPDPNSKPVPNATVALYVDESTLTPTGPKGSNYIAVAHRGELKYKDGSNQTLTFTLPNEIQYGSELTLVATSNQDSLLKMPITFTSTSEDVKIVGDKLTALKIAKDIEVVAHQAGNQALGVDPATATAILNIGKRVLSVEMPAQKVVYDGNEHGYNTSEIKIGNIINEDEVTWTYSTEKKIEPRETPYDVTVTLTGGNELYTFADGDIHTEGALYIMKKPLNFTQTKALPDSTYTAEMQYCDTSVFTFDANQIIAGDATPEIIYYNGAKNQGQNLIRVEVDTTNSKYTTGTATTFTGREAGNGVFEAVFNILPAELKIDFADTRYSRKVGTDNPVLDTTAFKFDGFLKSDTITTLPTYATTATKESPIGEYSMTLNTTRVQFSTQKGNYTLKSPTEVAKLSVVEKYISEEDYIIEGNKQFFDGKTKNITLSFKAGAFDDFNPAKDAKITYLRSGSTVSEPSAPGQYIVNIKIAKQGIAGKLEYVTTLDIARAPLNLTYYNTVHIYDKTQKSVTYEIIPSQPNDEFFKTYRASVVFHTTYNDLSDIPSQVGEYNVRTWLGKNDPYYTLDASTKMTINRAESMPVGFGLPNVVTIKEPVAGDIVEIPVTIKSLNGFPIRSGATVRINVTTSMEIGTYIVPEKVVFNDMDSAVFKIAIKKGGNTIYNNQELLLSLASDEADIRIDNPTQYRVIVENTDESASSSSARFMSATASAIEGSTVYGSIVADDNGGEATVKVSSKTDLYNVFVNNQLVDKKEFKVRLTGTTPTSLMIVLDPSYTANAKVEPITFSLVSFTYFSGLKGTVDKKFNKFVVSVKNTNPLIGVVDLTDTIASNGQAIFDVVSFVKESYVSNPAYSLRLEKAQYVESKLSEKGARVSIKNNKIVYDYSAIMDLIKNPEIGFNDTFTCIIDDGYGGKTEVSARVFISCNYTIGSSYEVRVTDFERGAGNVFIKSPQISGQYIDPFAKVKAGGVPKIKKSSMKAKSDKGATFANIEITKKIKLVNASALSKFRSGKYKEIVNGKEVTVAPNMFLDDAHNHAGIVVESIGVQLFGKSNFSTSKEGENIGALIISHPAVREIDYGHNIVNNKAVIILNGDCFGKTPIGLLEYRRTDNKIGTIKLKMLKSTTSKSVIIKGADGKNYVAPTNDQIKLSSTEKSILIFELPTKYPSNRADKRLDILIDSGSGISGVKNISTP